MVSELQTGRAPAEVSSSRPMSEGPPGGQGADAGASLRPFPTSHVTSTPGAPLALHVMLPVGLWKIEPTSAAVARSSRCLASSKERGAPRCLPTASAVGTAVLVGRVVAGVVGAAEEVCGGVDVVAPGASTVTVTVRRGVGMSVSPQAVSASRAAAAAHTAATRRVGRRRAAMGGRVRSGIAQKSGTEPAPDHGPPQGRASSVTYAGWVLRGLLSPRWVGLFAVMLAVVAVCTLLGLWQLGVARDEGRKQAVAAAAQLARAPLQQVTRPHSAFEAEFSNRPVSATGTYDDARTILVVDRRLGDRVGSWVVTPLVTASGTVAVLRGFVDGLPASAPAAPSGVVTVAGSLGPAESPRAGAPLPAQQRRSIDLAALVNEWPGDLYNVIVLASTETESGSSAPVATAGLTRVPPPELDAPLNLRNAAYAVQWWAFGLFAIWMWWKMFRAEQQSDAAPAAQREEIPA